MRNTLSYLTHGLNLTLLGACLTLAACGGKDSKPAATQVAAKVGSEEISVHQINQVLQRTNAAAASPEAVRKISRDILEKLIDQQLAVEQANQANLNRTPEVIAQIEAARRDILARAYLQQVTSGLPKPSTDDSKKYYAEHPQLFAERRIYNLQEINLAKPVAGDLTGQLRGLLDAGKSFDDVAAFLKAQNIAFKGGPVSRAAEQVPMDMLAQLHPLKDGQSLLFEAAQALTLLHIVSTQTVPVTEADALPRIGQFLANQRAADAIASEIKRLRGSVSVTYMGEFATPDGHADATKNNEQNPALTPVTAAQAAIEKGIAGLK